MCVGSSPFINTIQFGLSAVVESSSEGAGSGIPAGSILAFGGQNIPNGWLLCNGNALHRQKFISLFKAISTMYGEGDGISTFNLPDLRGRVVVGAGQGLRLSNRELAATFGAEQHTLTVNEMPSHSHGINDPGHVHDIGDGSRGQRWGINDGGRKWVFGNDHQGFQNNPPTLRAQSGVSILSNGANAPHSNMPPSIAINYIIKY
ncbi:unnamed protein product [Rotaria magnacalcarata]|uniref:Phage tail collar domain-containing protein n=1 Tax=Rotaria magnacalcarata TaxID=392030 RepID=A0A816NWK8_9BILA|nr:unnamed protein product [Rotaria magnacalcarata]